MSLLSVVMPAYNEEQMLPRASRVLSDLLSTNSIDFELVFVDDGSSDATWRVLQEVSATNPRVRGIHFSRNFGKEAAIMAGLAECSGDCCVVMDCDLQHPPATVLRMYELWQQGYEVVEGVKSDRGEESRLHRFAAQKFYDLMSAATGFDMASTSDFKLLDRKAIDALVSLQEKNAFFRALSAWVGFRTTTVEFEVQERAAGESKWSTRSLVRYAIRNITSFSAAPMQAVTLLGAIMLAVALVFTIIALVQKFNGTALEGFTTVIILQLFSSSIIMISIGILGYYISRIFEEVKNRPIYIISETCGTSEEK